MERGLDELIESLLTEIAFSGVRGCSVSAALKVIETFYGDAEEQIRNTAHEQCDARHMIGGADTVNPSTGLQTQHENSGYDFSVGSKVWGWLVARADVSVGTNRQFNHLPLDELLSLPEEDDVSGSVPASPGDLKTLQNATSTSENGHQLGKQPKLEQSVQKYRPRLHVSEERQWKTLAGHGPDLKRVPLFEWKALVDIASVREKGILQGDLVRLSGQDKRSLPTRTEALARKGYIIKQPIILRGCRSSKLWLAKFAKTAKENRDGLNFDKIDVSKEALTKDLAPVPFSSAWNGERLDYIAIAQAFHAVVKAWGVMRYCDVRIKLDIENRVPQMRALAKTSRWFTSIGAVTFVAARFANGQRLFKDCVKFIRDPTADEWRVFRSTPSAHINVPSARLGKRGQASRARYNQEINFSPHSQINKRASKRQTQSQSSSQEEPMPSLWNRHKPIVNTTFEIIQRAGPEGSSNVEIGRLTLGHAYRKYTAALTGQMSLPNSQPPHLGRFNVSSQLSRHGKTMAYQFVAKSEVNGSAEHEREDGVRSQEANAIVEVQNEDFSQKTSTISANGYTFSQPVLSKFATASTSSLTQIHNSLHHPKPLKGRKRKRISGNEPTEDIVGDGRPRPSKKSKIGQSSTSGETPGEDSGVVSVTTSGQEIEPPRLPTPRPPGIHREVDNFLDPPGKKGRRKKSLVLTFKFNSLKDWSFLDRMRDRRPAISEEIPCEAESSPPLDPELTPSQTANMDDSMQTEKSTAGQNGKKKAKQGGKGKASYRCEKCGNSWKNSNGLEYHLSKSQTACNPEYIPPPPKPPKVAKVNIPKPKPIPKTKPPRKTGGQSQDQTLSIPDPSQTSPRRALEGGDHRLLPSKRVRSTEHSIQGQNPQESSRNGPIRGSIVLQDVEAYDVVDHRRQREHSQVSLYNTQNTIPQPRHTSQRLSQLAPKQLLEGGEDVVRSNGVEKNLDETITCSRHQTPIHDKEVATLGVSKAELSNFSLRPPVLNNTSNVSRSNSSMDFQAVSANSSTANIAEKEKPRKRSQNTIGTVRRERASHIIQHLIDHNDGVFPGQRSLYLAMTSLWNKRHTDIPPPDLKVCQNVVNNMEKAGKLLQLHFFFLDHSSQLQECCVLATPPPEAVDAARLTASPKVVAVKEKMREMFPEPYIPEAFSLPQDESQLFDALASRYKDKSPSNVTRKSTHRFTTTRSGAIEDIEVLQYPSHVVSDVSTYATGSKRHMEQDEPTLASPTKKVRLDNVDIDKPRNSQKLRKRSEHREYWDTGKVAKYIWTQKQSQGEKWEQKHAYLQDFATGAWSAPVQETTSLAPSIDTILSSPKNTHRNTLNSIWRRSNNMLKASSGSTNTKHTISSDTGFWNGSQGDGNGGTYDEVLQDALEKATKEITANQFVEPAISTSFVPEDSGSDEEEDEEDPLDAQHTPLTDDNPSTRPEDAGTRFAENEVIKCSQSGKWPWLPASYFESNSTSFLLAGAMPNARWFQRENLPQGAGDILRTYRGRFQFTSWADPSYGKFLREVGIIERWEQSAEGSRVIMHGSVAPDYIFMSLSSEVPRSNMKPITLEWPSANQFTPDTLPDDIKNASADDENIGLPNVVRHNRGRPVNGQNSESRLGKAARSNTKKNSKATQIVMASQPEVQYKTRSLRPIPIQPRGRVNRPLQDDDALGLSGETELIAAHVVFKTLLGGVDRKVDIGLILKTFPRCSHSALRKFWPRVSKERKTYIDALTVKFQSAFLEAYEEGQFPPLNYDDVESYDWKSLIIWATKLETHENVHLPKSRRVLEETYSLENVANEAPDWRETWFHGITSIYARMEGTSSEPISIPLNHGAPADDEIISRARSWVRSLCVTRINGANAPEEIRKKLLQLSGKDDAETNKLLKKVVDRLVVERVAARSKGKILGQSLRLHGIFAKQLEKSAPIERLEQAAHFKAQLDASFRHHGGAPHVVLPYVANEGTILAVLNLQAHARIRIDPVDPTPNIPFGFEPGNYDGRTFPKSYYHFALRLSPTSSYLLDQDLPLLAQVEKMQPPTRGARGEIPIWVDFHGRLDQGRWITYLCMVVLALATKGPLTPHTASTLLKPFVEPFEARAIMDWVEELGLLGPSAATVGEWWWLAVGRLAMGRARKVEFQR
ncbi:uncharacterized protein GGS25DRAFT_531679 [Hypoxylon fragiforme]|uniref:uncharacterized protein n=1 Tax=Hypoxylon fragiforme TaxID=63214 RepID=UPI0020C66381|nr:uncharacterized protein GGS25DRAFT_531679 [Hypoxylon fragiforme]KAI2608612.1 hypothetical protein GGS25DRAFT_531679 [Hypoxylon fragiforme]